MSNRESENGGKHPEDALAHKIYRELCEKEGIEPYTNKEKTTGRTRTALEEKLDTFRCSMERIGKTH